LLDGSKTVTRRTRWLNLKAGDHLMACDKCMGIPKGGKATVYGEIEIVDVRREPLNLIDEADCISEGFPDMTPTRFVAFFCAANKCQPDDLVTRIEFRRVGDWGTR
jgi:hypothetical protein